MGESGPQVWTVRRSLFDLKAMCCETHDCQGTTCQLGHHIGTIDHYQKGHPGCVKALWGTRAPRLKDDPAHVYCVSLPSR